MIILPNVSSKQLDLFIDTQNVTSENIITDKLRLNQVLLNILTNAIKYTDSGRIDITPGTSHARDNCVELRFSVKDTGQGIRDEDRYKLFSMYSRLDKKKNNSREGTGIGLAICKYFVDRMAGSITVNSTYGKGSEFSFTIPQKIADNIPNEPQTGISLQFATSGARILLTADGVTGVVERLMSIGMNDCIMKPIDPDKLFQTIRKYLPESKTIGK